MEFEIFPGLKNVDSDNSSVVADLKSKLKPSIIKRAVFKRQITLIIKRIDAIFDSSDFSQEIISQLDEINNLLEKIKEIDDVITSIYTSHDIMDIDTHYFENEIESRGLYHIDVTTKISQYKIIHKENDVSHTEKNTSTIHVPYIQQEALPPSLSCPSFYGDKDRHDFKSFLEQFENLIGSKSSLTDSAKLQYLKSYLRGNAYKVIQHLSNSNENYDIALMLLQEEFLDEQRIIHEILDKLINTSRFNNADLEKLGLWLSETRARLYELKSLKVDFLTNESSGCVLMSHIITSKLPPIFLRELIQKSDSNYPTLDYIFENFNRVIKQLLLTKPSTLSSKINLPNRGSMSNSGARPKTSSYNTFIKSKGKTTHNQCYLNKNSHESNPRSRSSSNLQNLNCKFCSLTGHSMSACQKYKTAEDRIQRCKTLGLCTHCSSAKHDDLNCPGLRNELSFRCFKCKSYCHITPLCTQNYENNSATPSTSKCDSTLSNLCINAGSFSEQDILLPTLTVTFMFKSKYIETRCLLDLGSQRSYLDSSLMQEFGMDLNSFTEYDCTVKTFNGEQVHKVSECALTVEPVPGKTVFLPILFTKLDLNFKAENLDLALNNIRSQNMCLADSHYQGNSDNNVGFIKGLLGNDILQYIYPLKFTKVLNGTAIEVTQGIIPFGHVGNFLSRKQLGSLASRKNLALKGENPI